MTPVALRHGQVVNLRIGHSFLSGEVVYSIAEGDYFRTGVRVLLPANGATGISDLLRTMLIEQHEVDPVAQEKRAGVIRRAPSRRHLRYSISEMLRFLWPEGDRGERIVNARIENACAVGARLRVDEKIPVDSCFSCNDEALGIKGTATVRYCRSVTGKYDIGLEFATSSGSAEPSK
jgi:hypothetical protein